MVLNWTLCTRATPFSRSARRTREINSPRHSRPLARNARSNPRRGFVQLFCIANIGRPIYCSTVRCVYIHPASPSRPDICPAENFRDAEGSTFPQLQSRRSPSARHTWSRRMHKSADRRSYHPEIADLPCSPFPPPPSSLSLRTCSSREINKYPRSVNSRSNMARERRIPSPENPPSLLRCPIMRCADELFRTRGLIIAISDTWRLRRKRRYV